LLVIIIILLTIFLIINYSNLFYPNTLTNNTLTIFDYYMKLVNFYSPLMVFSNTLASIAIAAFLRLITQNLKREFRFYFAKACCKIISEKNDEVEKMKYLFLLLSSYNKYLERNVKIEINDFKKIFSIILNKDTKQQVDIIKSICVSLDGDIF
jgi:hypothetical protein